MGSFQELKSYGKPDTYTGTGQASQGKKYRMMLNLTPQIEKEMANASAVTLRFNIENKPISIVYSNSEVEKLKDFMTLDPDKVD